MLGELGGQLVEVVGQLDLTTKGAERLGERPTALHRDEPRDGTAGALDDDLLSARGKIDEPGEPALGLTPADADHARTLAVTQLERARVAPSSSNRDSARPEAAQGAPRALGAVEALQSPAGHRMRVVTCGHVRSRIGIRELRDTLTATIRRVRNGETLEVTHDGEPVAIISPVRKDRIQQLVAGGDVTAPSSLTEPLRRFPVTGELTAAEAIEEDRAER